QREAVLSAIRQSHGIGEKLLGVAFNDVVARRARYYDYYKSGYYMKKYPHYYGSAGKTFNPIAFFSFPSAFALGGKTFVWARVVLRCFSQFSLGGVRFRPIP